MPIGSLWQLMLRRQRVLAIWVLVSGSTAWALVPTAGEDAAFDRYAGRLEARLDQEHEVRSNFMSLPERGSQAEERLRRGALVVENLEPNGGADAPGALLHDWRGTAFIRGGKAADFEAILRQYASYAKRFAPEVLAARLTGGEGDHLQAWMRVQQHHVLTVTLDTAYDVRFGRLDPLHGYSVSRSTKITEIDHAGGRDERALDAGEEHGYLWRLNTYWSWEERDGGLYVQIESISLTRAIPAGLGWAIGPFVESVPRESLEFTLRSACGALRER